MRIIFAGTPDFAVAALDALLAADHEVLAVYTQPDRPAGRGRKLTPSPVKVRAEAACVPVREPATLRDPAEVDALAALDADLMIVVAYGLILPQAVLDVPRLGCWNIHASLLPRWRGAAPIQRAIEAGDAETGVCLMQMEAGLDTGPVLSRAVMPIDDGDTTATLHDRLSTLGAALLAAALKAPDALHAEPQADAGVTYAHKIDKAEAQLDWSLPAVALWRRIRAFNPFPGARGAVHGIELKIWEAELAAGSTGTRPGLVIQAGPDGIVVTTGEGLLRLTVVQTPGKRRMSAGDFINAHRDLLP
ncbi:MAG: methionyl-tRNA formyltransferase [Pseudomonadota bacterium]